jgi:hypothetical protein
MTLIQADQLIPLSVSERSQLIQKYANSVNIPIEISSERHRAYQTSIVLTPVLHDFIQHQIQEDISKESILGKDCQSKAIARECEQFASRFIASMSGLVRSPAEIESSPSNLYEMCGASVFAECNSISRNLSTKMGELWEIIANISPYAASPEKDFGLKITGVDLIILCEGKGLPVFVQIKTQRNTLTGSQASRSRLELELHQHPLFAAAFGTGDSWTFSSPKNTREIPRVCGADFWKMVGLDYELLKTHVKQMVLKIQSAYIEMRSPKNHDSQ